MTQAQPRSRTLEQAFWAELAHLELPFYYSEIKEVCVSGSSAYIYLHNDKSYVIQISELPTDPH